MHSALLGLAVPIAAVAALTLSTPTAVEGQSLSSAGFSANAGSGPLTRLVVRPANNSVRIHRGGFGDGHDGDHRHHRRDGDNVFVGGWYDGDWAYANNRSWEPDSFNDWWHDRPDRSYPAWMRRNRNCDRMWYSGDTLVC